MHAHAPRPAARPVVVSGVAVNFHSRGFLFLCNKATHDECLERRLFGLPKGHWGDVKQIQPIPATGASAPPPPTPLFLLNTTTRTVQGPFVATKPAGLDIVPDAWREVRRPFPAQVRCTALQWWQTRICAVAPHVGGGGR